MAAKDFDGSHSMVGDNETKIAVGVQVSGDDRIGFGVDPSGTRGVLDRGHHRSLAAFPHISSLPAKPARSRVGSPVAAMTTAFQKQEAPRWRGFLGKRSSEPAYRDFSNSLAAFSASSRAIP